MKVDFNNSSPKELFTLIYHYEGYNTASSSGSKRKKKKSKSGHREYIEGLKSEYRKNLELSFHLFTLINSLKMYLTKEKNHQLQQNMLQEKDLCL